MPKINCPAGYHVVTDSNGDVSIVADTVPSVSQKIAHWAKTRIGETSTQLGVLGGTYQLNDILDGAIAAVTALATGDYLTAAQQGIPALLKVGVSIAAIAIPEDKYDQLKKYVSTLSREQLISLLNDLLTQYCQHPPPQFNSQQLQVMTQQQLIDIAINRQQWQQGCGVTLFMGGSK